MTPVTDGVQQPTLILDNGRVMVEVPWGRGEHFQQLLQRHGIVSILHLNPAERRAHLEPRTDLQPQEILRILEEK